MKTRLYYKFLQQYGRYHKVYTDMSKYAAVNIFPVIWHDHHYWPLSSN